MSASLLHHSDKKFRLWCLGSFFWDHRDHRDERDHSETEYHQNDNKFLCYLCRPYCLCCLFSQKRRSLLTITNYSLLITNCIFAPSDKKLGRGADVAFDSKEKLGNLGNLVNLGNNLPKLLKLLKLPNLFTNAPLFPLQISRLNSRWHPYSGVVLGALLPP